ncbi:hypothetical protein E4U55_005812 [Claviceps digitariae]|nr:hypothetical protein E4U55_005812 [Claviceps digitariae]
MPIPKLVIQYMWAASQHARWAMAHELATLEFRTPMLRSFVNLRQIQYPRSTLFRAAVARDALKLIL